MNGNTVMIAKLEKRREPIAICTRAVIV